MAFICKQNPKIEPRLAVSLLISSNFLKMHNLQNVCLNYIHDNISDVVKIPIDMGCINQELMVRLSDLFTLNKLSLIEDPKDRITSTLFFYKLKDLFDQKNSTAQMQSCSTLPRPSSALAAAKMHDPIRRQPHYSTVMKCTNCQDYFIEYRPPKTVTSLQSWSTIPSPRCSNGALSVDIWGWIGTLHSGVCADINAYIAHMYVHNCLKNWKLTFWSIWGSMYHLKCTSCSQILPANDYLGSGCLIHRNKNGTCCFDEKGGFEPFTLDTVSFSLI